MDAQKRPIDTQKRPIYIQKSPTYIRKNERTAPVFSRSFLKSLFDTRLHFNRICVDCSMGWLRLVGSLKLYVSFAKKPYKRDDILPNAQVVFFNRTCGVGRISNTQKCPTHTQWTDFDCGVDTQKCPTHTQWTDFDCGVD